jgi:hypothetical protein
VSGKAAFAEAAAIKARIATRYDKLAANYLAFKLAAIRIWRRAYESTPLVHLEKGPKLSLIRGAKGS